MSKSQPLPPYSGKHPTCPKCQHGEATTKYRREGTPHEGEVTTWAQAASYPERLERECSRCGFVWDERLASAEQAAPVDWQAIVERGERELKAVGEARRDAEDAIARVRAEVARIRSITPTWEPVAELAEREQPDPLVGRLIACTDPTTGHVFAVGKVTDVDRTSGSLRLTATQYENPTSASGSDVP